MSSKTLPAPAKHLFRHLFDQASLGIAVEDLEGNLLLANPALCSLLGYTEKELCSMSCSQFANPEDSEDDWALFQQLRAGIIDHYSLEKRYLRKDGAQLWGRLNVSLSKEDDEGTPLVFAFVEEITERKLVEREIARTADRLQLALEAGRSVGWEWDLKSGRDSWFGDLQTMFGIPSDRFSGRLDDFYRYVHPEDRGLVAKAVADARQHRKPYAAEFRVVRLDGSVRWIAASGKFYYGTNGDAERMLGMAADITERKQAEERLREYEKAVEGSEEMIAVVDREYRYLIANRRFLNLRNMTKDQVIGRLVPEVLNKGIFEESVKGKLDECFAGKVVRYEMKYTYPELGERDVLASYFPIEGATGIDRVACILQDITERKRAEDALRQRDADLTEAQRLAGVGSWRWDARTDRVTWSRELCRLVGRDPSLPAPTFKEYPSLFTAASWDRLEHAVEEALQTGTSYELDMQILTPESTPKWAIARGEALRDANGEIIGLQGTVQDITERKLTEQALQDSEARERARAKELETVLNAIPMPVRIAHDAGCRRMTGNQAAYEQARVPMGRNFSSSAPPGEGPLYRLKENGVWVAPDTLPMQQAAATGKPVYGRELTVVYEDGTERQTVENAVPLLDEAGEPRGAVGASVDVTEQKQAEGALRESEARERARVKELETILDAVPVPVLIAHDPSCRRITGNRAAYAQLRVPSGRNFSLSATAEERPSFRQIKDGMEIPADLLPIQQTVATGEPVYGRPMTMLFADGTMREEIVNVLPLLDEAGKPRGAVAASVDMTEQRQAERALRESEDKLRLLLDSTAEAIYGIDLEHRCTFCNIACLRALGYERVEELVGKNMHDLIHHHRADGTLFPAEECRVHRVLQAGDGNHAEDEVLWRANGTSFPAEYWSYPQRRGQQVIGAVVAFVDITQRKLAEAALANVSRKLIEAQEQERTRIARELHDDIGQRLAMLAMEMEHLPNSSDLPTQLSSRVRELWKQTAEIATDVQSLSHELHSSKLQYLGITAAVRSFCKEFGEQQKVEIDFASHDLPSPLSPDTSLCLFRVLQEALHNSAKHSGVRGFEVRLWGTTDELHLTVHDSGAGFDREAAKTSHGLGLISMEERLKLVNGTLSIESQPKSGTTIHARVPLGLRVDSLRASG